MTAKLFYNGQLITTISTNHSMSIEDALKFTDISKEEINEVDENGELKYDYEAFTLEVE